MKKIFVYGAGAWGTALAVSFSTFLKDAQVYLTPRRPAQAEAIETARENTRYLPGISLPPDLVVNADVKRMKEADYIIWSIPTQHTPQSLLHVKDFIQAPVIVTSKGFVYQAHGFSFLYDILKQTLSTPVAFLSGPNLAREVAKKLPAAATLACDMYAVRVDILNTFHHALFRLYGTHDVQGVQIAGALKNVYAIAAGILRGKKMGQNALSVLITRALAEMTRYGLKHAAERETFLGLSAVGDLMLTCSSVHSRNNQLGFEISQGHCLEKILEEKTTVAEGAFTIKAFQHNLEDMPLCQGVYNVLYQHTPVEQAISALIHRPCQYAEN